MGLWKWWSSLWDSMDTKPTVIEEIQVPLNPLFIDDKFIPEVVLDRNVGIYNCGYDKQLKGYKIIVFPCDKENRG